MESYTEVAVSQPPKIVRSNSFGPSSDLAGGAEKRQQPMYFLNRPSVFDSEDLARSAPRPTAAAAVREGGEEGEQQKSNNKRFCAFMLARGGSKGVPKKNIAPINGRPLLDYSLQSALSSGIFEDIWVSTDSQEIADTVRVCSPHFKVFQRDPSTATDTASSELAIQNFVEGCPKKYDAYCLIQATSPLTLPVHFKEASEQFLASGLDSLVTVVKKHCFLWKRDEKSTAALPTNYFTGSRPRRQDWNGIHVENGAFYMFTAEHWHKERNRLGGRMGCYEMPPHTEIELDNRYELDLLTVLCKQFAYQPPFLSRVDALVLDFDGVLTDCKISYVVHRKEARNAIEDGGGGAGDKEETTVKSRVKTFDMKDGHGVSLLKRSGVKVFVVSRSPEDDIVRDRCTLLGIDSWRCNVKDKGPVLKELLESHGIDTKRVAYMGDDIPDLDCLRMVGLPSCPSDAHDSVKASCRFVSSRKGGKGAVRTLCDYILDLNQQNN